MSFRDHFSKQANAYSEYRPHYPEALFKFLAEQLDDHSLVWDCATGSGQAALGLVPYFERVIASDASGAQLKQAVPHAKIVYRVATAEASHLDPQSVDLVTVAQALHWFDLDRFYAEVKRVLKPDGRIAVWTYNLHRIAPPIDAVIDHFYREVVGPYWPPERTYVETNYRTIPFPFQEIETPAFEMSAEWGLNQLIGYLYTWSATTRFMAERGFDPVASLKEPLAKAWGFADAQRTVHWPLFLRMGKVS